MTRQRAMQAIAAALDDMHVAYWAACDAEGRAIDPADLGAPEGLLDDAHDIALTVEALAADRGITWADARELT